MYFVGSTVSMYHTSDHAWSVYYKMYSKRYLSHPINFRTQNFFLAQDFPVSEVKIDARN